VIGLRLVVVIGLRLVVVIGLRLVVVIGLRLVVVIGLRLVVVIGLRLVVVIDLVVVPLLGCHAVWTLCLVRTKREHMLMLNVINENSFRIYDDTNTVCSLTGQRVTRDIHEYQIRTCASTQT